jgi:hypothetical protein
MILRKAALLVLISLFVMGLSEPSKGESTPVSGEVIMPTLLQYLVRQGITIKVPKYMEKDFTIVFDELPDLKPEDRQLITNLQLDEAQLSDITIKVKLDELQPVGAEGKGRGQVQQHFLLNAKNDLHCMIKSFQMEADLKITSKGKDLFGNKLAPIRATIDKFELNDIDSLFNFFLSKSGEDYYAEDLSLKRMVLSPKASIKIKEFPPIVNQIVSDIMGPAIADIGNKEVLNDKFYKEFNANLPPRIPEESSPALPSLLKGLLKEFE